MMKQTYLLIEVLIAQPSIIEDIHGVSDSIDTLKGVADEENWDEPLEWKRRPMEVTEYAVRTKGHATEFKIIKTNNYETSM